MTKEENLINWLIIGIRQEPSNMSELFYFDQSKNHFFSLIASDFMLLEQQTEHGYNEADLKIVLDKLQKIKCESPEIIPIPRLSVSEREPETLQDIKAEKIALLFLSNHKIDVSSTGFWFPQL